jgi:hypothetical protein
MTETRNGETYSKSIRDEIHDAAEEARAALKKVSQTEKQHSVKIRLETLHQKIAAFLARPDNKLSSADITALKDYGSFLANMSGPAALQELSRTFTRATQQAPHLTLRSWLQDSYHSIAEILETYEAEAEIKELGQALLSLIQTREETQELPKVVSAPGMLARLKTSLSGWRRS